MEHPRALGSHLLLPLEKERKPNNYQKWRTATGRKEEVHEEEEILDLAKVVGAYPTRAFQTALLGIGIIDCLQIICTLRKSTDIVWAWRFTQQSVQRALELPIALKVPSLGPPLPSSCTLPFKRLLHDNKIPRFEMESR